MIKKPALRGNYIPVALERYCMNGDAYVSVADSYRICCGEKPGITYAAFQKDLTEQFRLGTVVREGGRLYLKRTLRYEVSAANYLAGILSANELELPLIPEKLTVGELILCEEQREAVCFALSHRLSVILGGAGSGKTTLIRAIASQYGGEASRVICAPTGKAARNLTERTGCVARTVHSALGMQPNEDFLSPVIWENVGLVIVDEASMMTLEMLVGILCKMRKNCRVVLLGDPNQLLSVGSGNVLPDLLRLKVPHVRLVSNHRQEGGARGLLHNVVGFSELNSVSDLAFDDSFMLVEMEESLVRDALVEEAVKCYLAGESVQVLSPYNRVTELSVAKLNAAIQNLVNPAAEDKRELRCGGKVFREGDRVIITKNDRERDCSNGDVGVFHILELEEDILGYCVELPKGRCPAWHKEVGMKNLSLAYALTVHKVQGSETDTILMPIADSFSNMLYRNLLYTAISRGKKKVVIYGSRNALSVALQTLAAERQSQLVAKTHMAMLRHVG